MIKQKSCWVLEAESRVLFLGCLVWHGQAFSFSGHQYVPPEKGECWTRRRLSVRLTPSSPQLCPGLLLFLRQSGCPLVSLFACPSCDGRFHNLHPSWAHVDMRLASEIWNREPDIWAEGMWAEGISPAQNGPPSCQRGRDCGSQRNPFGLLWTSDPKPILHFLPWKWWTSFKILFD